MQMEETTLEERIAKAKTKVTLLAGHPEWKASELEETGHIYVSFTGDNVYVWYLDFDTEICISVMDEKILTKAEMDKLCDFHTD